MAFDFFKKKSADNNDQFSREMKRILYEYDDVRRKFYNDEKKIKLLVDIVTRQERIVKELKVFLVECLDAIFLKVETKQYDIVKAIEEKLPTFQHSRLGQVKENPFSMYCSYIDYVRPIELADKDQERKEEIAMLIEENKARETELNASNLVCEAFLSDEQKYREEIKALKEENKNIKGTMEKELKELRLEIAFTRKEGEDKLRAEKESRAKYEEMVKKEMACLQSATEKALSDREDMRQKLLKVRGVLRVPRLWQEFRTNLEKLKQQITEAGHKKG